MKAEDASAWLLAKAPSIDWSEPTAAATGWIMRGIVAHDTYTSSVIEVGYCEHGAQFTARASVEGALMRCDMAGSSLNLAWRRLIAEVSFANKCSAQLLEKMRGDSKP
jgi:hypothetical protein